MLNCSRCAGRLATLPSQRLSSAAFADAVGNLAPLKTCLSYNGHRLYWEGAPRHDRTSFSSSSKAACFSHTRPYKRQRNSTSCPASPQVSQSLPETEEARTEVEGQVISAQANFMTVRVRPGDTNTTVELLCVVRALLKKMRERVLVGDFVRVISIDWIDMRGVVESVLPRQSELQDPAVANVDQVLLVFSLAEPPWDGQAATRFLVSAEACHVPITVLLNKADLAPAPLRHAVQTQVAGWGYEAVLASAHGGGGLEELRARLRGHTSVVAGPSGVGKSSLINALLLPPSPSLGLGTTGEGSVEGTDGDARSSSAWNHSLSGDALPQLSGPECRPSPAHQVQTHSSEELLPQLQPPSSGEEQTGAMLQLQPVGEVTHIGRGRHTTRHVALLEVGGGLLADSPGFNQPSLADLTPSELPDCFPEIRERLDSCAFRNCQHLQEPGCAVREGWQRHTWYSQLHAELTEADDLARHRSASKIKRQGTSRTKQGIGGSAKREALLNPKAHRRVNRKQAKQQMQELVQQEADP